MRCKNCKFRYEEYFDCSLAFPTKGNIMTTDSLGNDGCKCKEKELDILYNLGETYKYEEFYEYLHRLENKYGVKEK